MKHKLKEITIFTLLLSAQIYIINNNSYIQTQTINSFNIWITKIVPILFPTFILVDIITISNIPYYIDKYLKINYIYIISIISGSPTNAYLINKTKNDKTKLLATTKYISLTFSYIAIKNIFNTKIALILIFLNIISNILIIKIIKPERLIIEKKENQKIMDTLIKSIPKSLNTLISILGTILLINLLPINMIKNEFIKSLILSFLEITSSLNNLKQNSLPLNIKLLLTIISISTCGLCIELQIKSILNDAKINTKNYIKYRLIHLILLLILSIPILYHIQN